MRELAAHREWQEAEAARYAKWQQEQADRNAVMMHQLQRSGMLGDLGVNPNLLMLAAQTRGGGGQGPPPGMPPPAQAARRRSTMPPPQQFDYGGLLANVLGPQPAGMADTPWYQGGMQGLPRIFGAPTAAEGGQ